MKRMYSISLVFVFYTFILDSPYVIANDDKITVVGKAIEIKHHAAVETDDSLLYYIDGKADWDKKYNGKRVRVTGKLFIKKWDGKRQGDSPEVTAIPQQIYGDRKIIKNAKWRLVR